jgi:hypothetical protein
MERIANRSEGRRRAAAAFEELNQPDRRQNTADLAFGVEARLRV